MGGGTWRECRRSSHWPLCWHAAGARRLRRRRRGRRHGRGRRRRLCRRPGTRRGRAGQRFRDTTNIRQSLSKTDPKLDAAVTVTVYDGRVLLTGQVPTPEMKMAAAQLARQQPNVRAVYDEIEVTRNDTFFDHAKDSWIGTEVRSDIVFDPEIRGVELHDRNRERLGIPDRDGAQPTGTAAGYRHRAPRARGKARRFLCRSAAGRAIGGKRPSRFGPARAGASARGCWRRRAAGSHRGREAVIA